MSAIVWLDSMADLDGALDELRAFLETGTAAQVAVRAVAVQATRDVSDENARRLAVRHETPQVVIVSDGRAAWHGSHFRVSAATIAARGREILDRSSSVTG